MYSYIRKNKWHYKTCLALAAGTTFQTQTVQASGTFVDYHAVLFSYSLVRLNWFAISLDGTYAKTRTYCQSAFQLKITALYDISRCTRDCPSYDRVNDHTTQTPHDTV